MMVTAETELVIETHGQPTQGKWLKLLQIAWQEDLERREVPLFPRQVHRTRMLVRSMKQYLNYLTKMNGRSNCYTVPYSEPQLEEKLLDLIVVEIDAHTFADAKVRAELLEAWFSRMDVNYEKRFSGRKGFHYYIFFKPLVFEYPAWTIRKFFSTAPPVMDMPRVGVIRQPFRVIYTEHVKTGLLCQPYSGDSLNSYYGRTSFPVSTLGYNPTLRETLHSIDHSGLREAFLVRRNVVTPAGKVSLPECLLTCLETMTALGELEHHRRVHLAAGLWRWGWTREQIIDAFRSAHDFKLKTTRDQVNGIIRTNMKCYRCKNALRNGICTSKTPLMCPFFPSINIFMHGGDSHERTTAEERA